MIRTVAALLAVAVAGMGAGPIQLPVQQPTQPALQPPPVMPNGRVCIEKSFGAKIPGLVEIFDKPIFGAFDDPRGSPVYLPYNQNVDVSLSETWRATARDFLVCNCQLAREIWWSREVVGNKAKYAHIKVVTPAPGALAWINAQLKANGYAPIP